MRLVDADALKAIRFHDLPYSQIVSAECDTDEKVSAYKLGWNDAIDAIVESVPTVDPIKHGHCDGKGFEPVRCSVCGITVDAINGIPWAIKSFNYCPNCGAKMDEVEDETN